MSEGNKAPAGLEKKSLEGAPDENRSFDHGQLQVVGLGSFKVARAVLQPGWKWSEDIKSIAGTDACQVEHNGLLLTGRMKVVADDGSEMEIAPGDAYVIPPGHEAWVVGDEPVTGIEFSHEAVEGFAKGE